MSAAALAIPFPDDFCSPTGSVLPYVWAFSQRLSLPVATAPTRQPVPHMGFYRKYTVALLRRYVRMSLEAGRTPSLLGREMFRSKVSHSHLQSFEDVVIFLHDIEHCLQKLDAGQQNLIARITLQEFTVKETSATLGVAPLTVLRHYNRALDSLTRIFLKVEILTPPKHCQGGKS